MRMKIALSLLLLLVGATAASAALLGVTPGFPLLSYDSNGTTTYDASTNLLTLRASPIALLMSGSSPPRFVNPTGNPASEVVSIQIFVDETGALVSGVGGDDLVIRGEVDTDGNGSIDLAGVLLTGEVLGFG